MSDDACDSPCNDATADPPEAGETPHAGLVLVSTPIGNLNDLSRRAIDTLKHAALILCEDTRMTSRLLSAYGIGTRTAPLHEHNEDRAIPGILALLRSGKTVALVSDAGTPLVSDPGYRLVRAAIAEGLPVGGVPGANAAIFALTLSGLPPHPFLFLGFAPPKEAARRAALAELRAIEAAGLKATLIWYEAPHRLADFLATTAETLGPRQAAIARELTKRFEEIRRGTLPDLAAHYASHPARGEITVVVGPPEDSAPVLDLDAALTTALVTHRLKEAVALVTAATGLPRKAVYARALTLADKDRQ
jgi:16S rRNA (cytidine1402-2'-O)-methyltransferase